MVRKYARRGGFTLIEIMIVVAIIALLAAIAVPSAMRARKRSQASAVLDQLRIIDAACDQWATENGAKGGDFPPTGSLGPYVKKGTKLAAELTAGLSTDVLGNVVGPNAIDSPPQVPTATFNALSDVADSSFWGPYYSGS